MASILASAMTMILIIPSTPNVAEAQLLTTYHKREVTIELEPGGGGLQTKGELTIPAVRNGPFPAVLLIHGSGATDRDEYLPPMVTGTGNESRPFWQIAEYLSERGFVVLRYDKRGIGENGTILDLNTVANSTVQQFQSDAEAALTVLMQQPEVDPERVTIIGHSEGAIIAPSIAAERPDDIQNVVLMSAAAQPISDIVSYQLVNRTLFFARQDWDANHDGLLSLEEVFAHPDGPLTIPAISNNDTATNSGNSTATMNDINGNNNDNNSSVVPTSSLNITTSIPPQQWYPGLDANGDTRINIDQELLPFRLAELAEFEEIPWFQSHEELNSTTIDIIENLNSTNILILHGEADIQTPLEQALMLEQKLTEVGHHDHTLITFPGLGHTFYPAQGSVQPLGPIREYVLSDLHSWLKDPDRVQ